MSVIKQRSHHLSQDGSTLVEIMVGSMMVGIAVSCFMIGVKSILNTEVEVRERYAMLPMIETVRGQVFQAMRGFFRNPALHAPTTNPPCDMSTLPPYVSAGSAYCNGNGNPLLTALDITLPSGLKLTHIDSCDAIPVQYTSIADANVQAQYSALIERCKAGGENNIRKYPIWFVSPLDWTPANIAIWQGLGIPLDINRRNEAAGISYCLGVSTTPAYLSATSFTDPHDPFVASTPILFQFYFVNVDAVTGAEVWCRDFAPPTYQPARATIGVLYYTVYWYSKFSKAPFKKLTGSLSMSN